MEQERMNQIKTNQNDDGKLLREENRKLYEEIQMLQHQKKTLALEESKRAEMCLIAEKYMKIREEENCKMKQELMRLKLEAQTLTYENRVKAARENQKYTDDQLHEKFCLECEKEKEKQEQEEKEKMEQ